MKLVAQLPREWKQAIAADVGLSVVLALVFVLFPLVNIAYALTHDPSALLVAGCGVVALFSAALVVDLVDGVRRCFGLRVVPQFERRLKETSDTYLTGHVLARHYDAFRSLPPLTREDPSAPFVEVEPVLREVQSLRASAEVQSIDPLARELAVIASALEEAHQQGLKVRFVLTTGTGMNSMAWAQLMERGF